MAALTQSFSRGGVSREHDNREFIPNNVDPERIKDNIYLVNESRAEAYEKCFGEAIREYNAKQRRKDRMYPSPEAYAEELERKWKEAEKKVRSGELERNNSIAPELEFVIGLGDKDTNWSDEKRGHNENREASVKSLTKFYDRFKKKYGDMFYVSHYSIHLDEDGHIHAHMIVIPLAEGYKKGLSKQPCLDKALSKRYEGNFKLVSFVEDCKAELEQVCLDNGIKKAEDSIWQQLGIKLPHTDTRTFKKLKPFLDQLEESLTLKRQQILEAENEYQEYYKKVYGGKEKGVKELADEYQNLVNELVKEQGQLKEKNDWYRQDNLDLENKNISLARRKRELKNDVKVEEDKNPTLQGKNTELEGKVAELEVKISQLKSKFEKKEQEPPRVKVVEKVVEVKKEVIVEVPKEVELNYKTMFTKCLSAFTKLVEWIDNKLHCMNEMYQELGNENEDFLRTWKTAYPRSRARVEPLHPDGEDSYGSAGIGTRGGR